MDFDPTQPRSPWDLRLPVVVVSTFGERGLTLFSCSISRVLCRKRTGSEHLVRRKPMKIWSAINVGWVFTPT